MAHFVSCYSSQRRSETSEWQEKWQQAVKELNDVKERAWTLLEEKDMQLQALKVIIQHFVISGSRQLSYLRIWTAQSS